MKVVVLFGPPGAGKGTQASLLASRLGARHVSTGGILRSQIASGSELGSRIKGIVESGRLVDDDTLFAALESDLHGLKDGTRILILDGVPRTVSQVERLDSSLTKLGLKVDTVLYISAPLERLVERFAKRWTCKSCGNVFSFADARDAQSATCGNCGAVGAMHRRADDAPEAVERRFRVYEEETLPVVQQYKRRILVRNVDGLQSPELVYVEVAAEVVPK